MFVGKKWFLCESPKPRKTCKHKVEASKFVLQRVCDVIWLNGKLRGTAGSFTTGAPWTWRHTGGRMEIMLEA
jgi:hypothetical protein